MQFDRTRNKVLSTKPSIDTKKDIRVTFFRSVMSCWIVLLLPMFRGKHLSNKNNGRVWKTMAKQYSLTPRFSRVEIDQHNGSE